MVESTQGASDSLLFFELRNVSKTFSIRKGIFKKGNEFRALDGINLSFKRGVFYGLIGESGSGKTTLARLLVRLINPSDGEIFFEGRLLTDILRNKRYKFRQRVQLIFQNPFMSLDPKWTIRKILEEGILELQVRDRASRVEKALSEVHLKKEYLSRKPTELSGGERQRVAIARALVMEPEFLILDEPTSQLDVSIQAQVVSLLKELSQALKASFLFITHDVALVSHLAKEIIVLHKGRVVEKGERVAVLNNPQSAYTKKLMGAIPSWP